MAVPAGGALRVYFRFPVFPSRGFRRHPPPSPTDAANTCRLLSSVESATQQNQAGVSEHIKNVHRPGGECQTNVLVMPAVGSVITEESPAAPETSYLCYHVHQRTGKSADFSGAHRPRSTGPLGEPKLNPPPSLPPPFSRFDPSPCSVAELHDAFRPPRRGRGRDREGRGPRGGGRS